jgi:hypothetical protein
MVRVWAEEMGRNNAWVASIGGDPQEHQHQPVGIEFPELLESVGTEAQEDDGEPFEEKMRRLTVQLREQQAEARRLDEAIWRNLKELGYDA